jgi:hypothetical protein
MTIIDVIKENQEELRKLIESLDELKGEKYAYTLGRIEALMEVNDKLIKI